MSRGNATGDAVLLVGGGIANSAGRDANPLSPAAAAADPEFRVGTLKLITGSWKSPGQRQRLLIVRSKTKTTRTNLTKLGLRPPPPSPQRELVLFSFHNRLECNLNMILQFRDRGSRMRQNYSSPSWRVFRCISSACWGIVSIMESFYQRYSLLCARDS